MVLTGAKASNLDQTQRIACGRRMEHLALTMTFALSADCWLAICGAASGEEQGRWREPGPELN
jgi:hypothetical protein